MIRRLSILRSPVVVAALFLAVASVATPLGHRSAPTAPVAPAAFGCNDPPIGAYVGDFSTCEECEFTGMDGASQGVWWSWHCRYVSGVYRLYVT
jgi:hypothetical protein